MQSHMRAVTRRMHDRLTGKSQENSA